MFRVIFCKCCKNRKLQIKERTEENFSIEKLTAELEAYHRWCNIMFEIKLLSNPFVPPSKSLRECSIRIKHNKGGCQNDLSSKEN